MMPPLALAPILLVLALGAFSSLLFVWQWTIGAPGHFRGRVAVHCGLWQRGRPSCPPGKNDRAAARRGWTSPHSVDRGSCLWSILDGRPCARLPPRLGGRLGDLERSRTIPVRGSAGAWQNMFVPAEMQGHPDYPLLDYRTDCRSLVARRGGASVVPIALSAAFGFLSPVMIATSASALSGDLRRSQAGFHPPRDTEFSGERCFSERRYSARRVHAHNGRAAEIQEVWPRAKTPRF